MTTKTNPNDAKAINLDQLAITGVDAVFPGVATILLGGVSYTPTQLKAVFQDDIDATRGADAAKADLAEKVAAKKEARGKAVGVRKDLKRYLVGAHGAQAVALLQKLGIQPPKERPKRSVASKAEAAVAAKATRKARGTLGPKARQKVTGKTATAGSTTPAPTPAPKPTAG
jgi:hypothetical protein